MSSVAKGRWCTLYTTLTTLTTPPRHGSIEIFIRERLFEFERSFLPPTFPVS